MEQFAFSNIYRSSICELHACSIFLHNEESQKAENSWHYFLVTFKQDTFIIENHTRVAASYES